MTATSTTPPDPGGLGDLGHPDVLVGVGVDERDRAAQRGRLDHPHRDSVRAANAVLGNVASTDAASSRWVWLRIKGLAMASQLGNTSRATWCTTACQCEASSGDTGCIPVVDRH